MAFYAPVKISQAKFEAHHHHPYGPVDNTFSDCDENRAVDEDSEIGWEMAHYFPGNGIWTKELVPSVVIMSPAPDAAVVVEEKLTPRPVPVESPTKTSFDQKSSGYYSTSSFHGQAEPSIGSQAGFVSSSRGPSGTTRAFRNCVHK